jgi:hypothetical protein
MSAGIEILNLTNLRDEDTHFLEQISQLQKHFLDPPDTLLLMHGIRSSLRLCRDSRLPGRILDLGCGMSFPSSIALLDGLADAALGIEMNSDAVEAGKQFATERGIYINPATYQILEKDIRDQSAVDAAIAFGPTIVAGNLPYLPEDEEVVDKTRDAQGGGTALIKLQLEYAQKTKAPFITTNFSSLTTPGLLFPLLDASGYAPLKLFVMTQPFGPRTSLLLEHGVFERNGGMFYAGNEVPQQLMFNLVLGNNHQEVPDIAIDRLQKGIQIFAATGACFA